MTGSWTCPTCKNTISTSYCPTCGESPPRPRDLTLRGLVAHLVHAFSSVDGRLLRSLRCLANRPGALTVAYVQGRRMPYLGPIPLFLIANAVFFAVQSLTSTNIFSSTLDSHLHQQDWNGLAQRLVAGRLKNTRLTLDAYAPVFDQAVVLNAKSLIILMVLPFAFVLPVLFHRSRQPFVAHAVFSLHLYTFLLLLFCVSLAMAAIDVLFGGAGLNSTRVDNFLSVFNLAACAVYLYFATGTVYGARGPARVVKALTLALTAAVIVLGYRFTVFLITLYSST